MNLLLDYKDDLTIVETSQNGWGDTAITYAENIKGLFLQGTSQAESGYVERIGTDAHAYLDIEDDFVKENAFRLEGMYLIANPIGGEESESWYKIARAKVGQRKLLDNDINNVHVFLTKCDALEMEES